MISPAVPGPACSFRDALDRLRREARQGEVFTGRYRSRYYDWGQGPALIFINGLGDHPESFALPMARLSGHFRCIAYSLPMGHHDRAKLGHYRHEHLLDDLLKVSRHLGVEAATVVGHSFGSTVALKALKEEPDRFPRGVLACGFAHRPLSRWHWWLGMLGKVLPPQARLCHLRGRVVAMRKVHYLGFDLHEPERWEEFLAITGTTPTRSLGHFGHLLHRLDLRPLLREVRQPVLLLCGDRDPLVPSIHQEVLFKGLPNSVMFQLRNCGHLPMYTHPEAMANALLTFLGHMPSPGTLHECGAGPDAAGHCPSTGQRCEEKIAAGALPSDAIATAPVVCKA